LSSTASLCTLVEIELSMLGAVKIDRASIGGTA
jgi:hypothetical protein